MSDRYYPDGYLSNNRRAVDYCFSLTSLAGAAAAPTFLEGDGFSGNDVLLNTSTGTFLTITRSGVGVYVIKTVDRFPGFICSGYQMAATTPAGQLTINATPGTQNADGTWSQTISCFNGASARELATGDVIYCWLRLRNGTNVP